MEGRCTDARCAGTETVLDQLGSRSVRWVYGRAWMNNRQIDVQQKMNDDDDDDDDNDDDNSDDKNDKIREGERVGNREMAWHEKGARHAKLNLD